MNDIEQDIRRIFRENNCHYDYSIYYGKVKVYVDSGDWKHDHLFLDYIMYQNGYRLKSEVVTEDNGSDCYSSTHLFEIFK